MPKWTEANIPSQKGKLAVVTGPTSGVGEYVALGLARAGAQIVLAARNPKRIAAIKQRISSAVPGAAVDGIELDLADLSSVNRFAHTFTQRYNRLDLLVNNAAVAAIPYQKTVDGFEMQIGVNHLGHFALTGLLLEPLLASPNGRVVTIASARMNKNLIQFDDLQSEKKYSRYGAYLQSKLANLLFALEFQRRIDAAGLALKSIAAQPGWTATNLGPGQSQGVSPLEKGIITITNKLFAHSAEVGARPPLYAATVENVAGGAYVCPDGFRNLHGSPTITDPGRAAQDAAVAARLWAVSEQLTKVSYQIPLLSRA